MKTRARRQTLVCVLVVLAASAPACVGNGNLPEDDFAPRTDVEREARERIRQWIDAAGAMLADPAVPGDGKAAVREAIARAREALARYISLREQGEPRAMIIAPIRVASAGIVADDVTGVGVANDWLLIPLGLSYIATHVLTDPAATQEELGQAWNHTLERIGELADAVDSALQMTQPGHVADTGIKTEMYAMITANGWDPNSKEDRCRALAVLYAAADAADDTRRMNRIRATQKHFDCRRSRRSRDKRK